MAIGGEGVRSEALLKKDEEDEERRGERRRSKIVKPYSEANHLQP